MLRYNAQIPPSRLFPQVPRVLTANGSHEGVDKLSAQWLSTGNMCAPGRYLAVSGGILIEDGVERRVLLDFSRYRPGMLLDIL